MGWLALLLLLALSLGVLWLLGVHGGLLKAAAAALLLGASGYALQGQPDLPGSPAQGSSERDVVPLTQARHAFFGNFSPEEIVASDVRSARAGRQDGRCGWNPAQRGGPLSG